MVSGLLSLRSSSGGSDSLATKFLKVVLIVGGVIGLVFVLTGVTTPLMYVSTGSMEPNINVGDMVVLTAYGESTPISDSDVTPVNEASDDDRSHGEKGDVIVFHSGMEEYPVVHRVHADVEKGENWVADMDSAYLPENTSCMTVSTCPAPNDGYITAGDDNEVYDQVRGETPVQADQILATAEYRIPYVGLVRMVDYSELFDRVLSFLR